MVEVKGITAVGFVGFAFLGLMVYIITANYWNAMYQISSPIDTGWAEDLIVALLTGFFGLLGNPMGRLTGTQRLVAANEDVES